MNAGAWFDGWLADHKRRNPHKEFRLYEAGDPEAAYLGWKVAFDRNGIDYRTALDASIAMQAEEKREVYPEHHPAILLRLAGRIREAERREREEAERAERRRKQVKEDARQERIRELWQTIDDPEKERFRDWARANNPDLARFEKLVEYLARNRWYDVVRAARKTTAGAR